MKLGEWEYDDGELPFGGRSWPSATMLIADGEALTVIAAPGAPFRMVCPAIGIVDREIDAASLEDAKEEAVGFARNRLDNMLAVLSGETKCPRCEAWNTLPGECMVCGCRYDVEES